MEEAVSERRKAFTAAHRSDEDRQAYISASQRASSVISKAKAEVWQATCSSLSPKSNHNLYALFFALLLGFIPHLFSLLTSLTVFLPGNRLRSPPITSDPTSLSLSQRPRIAEPKPTLPRSAESRALRSLTCSFANPFPPMNFLQLPPISPRSLSLAQTKLLIPC